MPGSEMQKMLAQKFHDKQR